VDAWARARRWVDCRGDVEAANDAAAVQGIAHGMLLPEGRHRVQPAARLAKSQRGHAVTQFPAPKVSHSGHSAIEALPSRLCSRLKQPEAAPDHPPGFADLLLHTGAFYPLSTSTAGGKSCQ
jgi:hypothetical protein